MAINNYNNNKMIAIQNKYASLLYIEYEILYSPKNKIQIIIFIILSAAYVQ